MILVDSCVLIDVFDADPTWQKWSLNALQAHHAQGWALLTRDEARYKTYFSSVKLITPETFH